MTKKIAIVQKCPSNVNYEKQFQLTDFDLFNLSSQKVSRLLKRDVDLLIQDKDQYNAVLSHLEDNNPSYEESDLGFCPELYDYVILIGSEALKMFTKATAVTDYTGRICPAKPEYKTDGTEFIASISPAVLAFKPENQPVFDQTVQDIHKIISGNASQGQDEGQYEYFETSEELNDYLEYVINSPVNVVALDSETSALAARDGYMLGMSMSHVVKQGIYASADAMDDVACEKIQQIIDNKRIVLHNAKFDMHFFKYHFGLEFDGRDIHDTMIMHYVLDERQGTHGLKSLTMKYGHLGDYDRELDEFKKDYCKAHGMKQEDFSYELIPWDIIKVYAAKDTDATLALYEKFYPIVQANERLLSCYEELLLPAMHFLTRMEDRGVPISRERLLKGRSILDSELVELKERLYDYDEVRELEKAQGDVFNPNSTKQLRALLFDHVGLQPTGKLTATGAISTDAEVLRELGEIHDIPKLILDIRQKSKLKNTYIDKLLPVIDRDNRVRTGFNLTSTTSGRLSSSGKFNMQQLPRDNPIIKGCVKAPEGYRIVAADLTTAEIYYAAVLSNDRAMQQVFINMEKDPVKYPDFHSNVAHMVFNLPCEPAEVKSKYPALRQAAKAIN